MNGSRYHAELKLMLMGKEAKINVFADTLNEVFADLATIVSQFPNDTATSPGKRDIENAKRLATQFAPQSQPAAKTPADVAPVCVHCGSPDSMELIEFTSRKTGKPARAWKCQECNEWHYPDRK